MRLPTWTSAIRQTRITTATTGSNCITSPTPLLLSDWYLSDDKANPKKWRIGDVLLDAGGRISFDEVNDFHNPITSGFGLDKGGEELILSYLPGDTTDRIVDYVRFMGQDSGTSLGRFPDGTDYWFAMPPSRDGVNLMPQSYVVIGEIMYHPAGAGEEYIELHNPTGQTAVLSGAAGPWRLDGEIAFEFPAQTAITAGGRLFIVGFDPVVDMTRLNAFVASYNTGPLTPGTDIVGPWMGARPAAAAWRWSAPCRPIQLRRGSLSMR